MSTNKPAFKAIDFGVIAAADKFAKQNGIPEIVHPGSEGEGVEAIESNVAPLSSSTRLRKVKAQPEPALPSPSRRLAVELPEYLVKAIADKAHVNETTNRYVVTQALQKAGFYVAPEDLKEDGRRAR